MPAIAVIAFVQAILKLAPEVVDLIEHLVNQHGDPIPSHKVPEILDQVAQAAKSSKDNDDLSSSGHNNKNPANSNKSVDAHTVSA